MRRFKATLPVLLLSILITAGCENARSGQDGDSTWKLGSRTVPGPLPPTGEKPIPGLDSWLNEAYGLASGAAGTLDLFKPKLCRGDRVPLAVFVHGGGWQSGSKEGVLNKAEAIMLLQLGFAVASINYRLAPQYPFPAQINDCKLAIRYLRQKADLFGIDPQRIGIWGSSAGGHLVLLMGAADDDDGLEGPGLEGISSRVKAVVDYFGPSDLVGDLPGQSQTVTNFLGCPATECPDKARQASPVYYATADDPPMLLIHGDKDSTVPYQQSVVMARALFSAGNACALIKVKNAGHGFGPVPATAEVTPSRETIYLMTAAHLARYLEPAAFGDLNLDGEINWRDEAELLLKLGTFGYQAGDIPAPDNWNPLADLWPDGRIDAKDLEQFSRIKSSGKQY